VNRSPMIAPLSHFSHLKSLDEPERHGNDATLPDGDASASAILVVRGPFKLFVSDLVFARRRTPENDHATAHRAFPR